MVGELFLPRLTLALRDHDHGHRPHHHATFEEIYLSSQEILKKKQQKPLEQEDSEFVA